MTTLYRPVLIESAEQAEALPEGIVLIRDDHYAFQKDKGRFVSADPHDLPVAHAWEVVGWTALVPIEAKEEWSARQPHICCGGTRGRTEFGVHESKARQHCDTVEGDVVERRLVTPWEEA